MDTLWGLFSYENMEKRVFLIYWYEYYSYSPLKCSTCMNTTNPYIQTLQEKGYSIKECSTPSKVQHTYPREIHGVVFETEESYNEALNEFLNGN